MILFIWSILCMLIPTNALASRSQQVLSPHALSDTTSSEQLPLSPTEELTDTAADHTRRDLLYALNVMQDEYYELWQGTWPTSIDWTAAVLGTHVSATLSSLTAAADSPLSLDMENLLNRFFGQISAFYFGEDAFSVRNQAFDDMLWIVLGWLESIKFQVLHSNLHYDESAGISPAGGRWYGNQLRIPAAHRARLFQELASAGWDTSLCGGGMVWNPRLSPYKNAITNELYISASVAMYLYFPGDIIDSPFVADTLDQNVYSDGYPHHPAHLQAAIDGYSWLNSSKMVGIGGLYADGFHISGWQDSNRPGSRRCDVLNPMVYTYNQGVILSGLRGLWLATASPDYLQDGHELVHRVIRATGWPNQSSRQWAGLGRGGVLEDACDSSGGCSQDGQTFKGIFFHHLAEFCRPINPQEARFLASANATQPYDSDREHHYEWHLRQCGSYGRWIEHNANAARATRNEGGKFGTWWGTPYRSSETSTDSPLPFGAIDYRNYGARAEGSEPLVGALRSRIIPEGDGETSVAPELNFSHRKQLRSLTSMEETPQPASETGRQDGNDRGRGRTVETQSGGVAVLRALYQWQTSLM